jgi:hypothetical protein
MEMGNEGWSREQFRATAEAAGPEAAQLGAEWDLGFVELEVWLVGASVGLSV